MLSTHTKDAIRALPHIAMVLAAALTPGTYAAAWNGLPGPRIDIGELITGATVPPPPYALRMPVPPPPLEDSPALAGTGRDGLSFTDRGASNLQYRLYRPTVVPLSRSEATMKGLGQATTVGWVLGALGTTAGLWDRETWGYMAAGSAVAGAILGGTTGYGSKGPWGTRIEWNIGDSERSGREEPR